MTIVARTRPPTDVARSLPYLLPGSPPAAVASLHLPFYRSLHQLGNPLGSLVYSDGLPGGDNSTLQQVVSWNYFIGSGTFCFKLCSPTADKNYCQK